MTRLSTLLALFLLAGCTQSGASVTELALGDDDTGDAAIPEGAGGGGEGWIAAPLPSLRITSPVSHRRGGGWARHDCATLTRANHRGTDYGVASGTSVFAAAAGTVLRSVTGCPNTGSLSSSCGGGFGNHVIVLHDGGYATLYAHLSPGAGQAARGARLGCGDLVGRSGNSGRSTGPHLHFEVRSGVTSEASYFSARTVDPFGGACSSQTATLWVDGASGGACGGTPGEREDAVVAAATHSGEVRGTAGMRLTQTFTMRNTGTTTWTAAEHTFVHVSGAFGDVREVPLPTGARVAPGASIQLRVDVTTPSAAGLHRGAWRMARTGAAIFGREATLAVRVASAPRGCDSATLGRRVEPGTCVQVTYAGCGMATCAWYACSDGAWLCTEADACGGESFPNAACGAPPPPPPDGEMCTGEGGGVIGDACDGEGQCCDGLECVSDGAGEGECCRGGAEPCARSSDCCGAMLCSSGFCACVPESQLCWADSDCCDGLSCLAGACRRPTGALEQASCSERADCAYPLNCQAASGGGATECCVSGGNRCESEGDCCGDMACTDGHCAYRMRGETCANLLDCGGALLCRDGACG